MKTYKLILEAFLLTSTTLAISMNVGSRVTQSNESTKSPRLLADITPLSSSMPVFASEIVCHARTTSCKITNATPSASTMPQVALPSMSSDGAMYTVQNSSVRFADIYSPQVPPGWYVFDGIRSVLAVPPGFKGQNGNAFSYAIRNQSVSDGIRGNAVGLFGTTTCEVDGCSSWGLNPTLISGTVGGSSGKGVNRKLIGAEFDISAVTTGTVIQGIALLGSSSTSVTGADGFSCGSLGGPALWSHCFVVNDAVAQRSGLSLGSIGLTGTPNSPSTSIDMTWYGSTSTTSHPLGGQLQLQAMNGALNVTDSSRTNGLVLMPANAGNAPSIAASGSDTNVSLFFSPKGSGTIALGATTHVDGTINASGYGQFARGIYSADKNNAVPPSRRGFAMTGNQSAGVAEVNVWNTYPDAVTSFRFNQITGTGTFVTPLATTRYGIKLRASTTNTLPPCNSLNQDTIALISDAKAPSYRGELHGGGSLRTIVECDGVAWTTH